jgi:hypothetical protein
VESSCEHGIEPSGYMKCWEVIIIIIIIIIIIVVVVFSGLRLCPLDTVSNIGLLYQSQMIDDSDCGTIGGIKIGRGN